MALMALEGIGEREPTASYFDCIMVGTGVCDGVDLMTAKAVFELAMSAQAGVATAMYCEFAPY